MERRVAGAVGVGQGAVSNRRAATLPRLLWAATRALAPVGAVSLTFAPAANSTLADSTASSRAANSSGVKPAQGPVLQAAGEAVEEAVAGVDDAVSDSGAGVDVRVVVDQGLRDRWMIVRRSPHERRLLM